MLLFLVGIITGIISGMGIGGGAILIPSLSFLTPAEHQTIQGVNLMFFVPISIVALIIHAKNGHLKIRIAIPIILFGLLGAYAGSKIAVYINGDVLKKIFGGFLLLIGVYELFKKHKTNEKNKQ